MIKEDDLRGGFFWDNSGRLQRYVGVSNAQLCTRSKNKLLTSGYKTVINSKPMDHVNAKNSMKEKNIIHESLTRPKKRIDKNEKTLLKQIELLWKFCDYDAVPRCVRSFCLPRDSNTKPIYIRSRILRLIKKNLIRTGSEKSPREWRNKNHHYVLKLRMSSKRAKRPLPYERQQLAHRIELYFRFHFL